jgi:hypothetical protein
MGMSAAPRSPKSAHYPLPSGEGRVRAFRASGAVFRDALTPTLFPSGLTSASSVESSLSVEDRRERECEQATRLRSVVSIGALALLLATSGCSGKNAVGLDTPEQMTLYSIDGRDFPQGAEPKADEKFHRYPVLGKIEITGPTERSEIAGALKSGLTRDHASGSGSFWPRHAIRVVKNGRTTDYLIAFDCEQLIMYVDRTPERRPVTKVPQPVFDKYLTAAHVPLVPN